MIRNAQETDLPRLTEIELRANRVFPAGRVPDLDDTIEQSDMLLAISHGLLFVACEDDQVVGYAMCDVRENVLTAGDRVLHLCEVAVDPQFGRRGIGRRLVEFVVAESRSRDLSATTLTTFADVKFNGPFYESAGFHAIATADLMPSLAAVLADEEQQGFTNRVAMSRVNPV